MGLSQNPEYEKALILDNHLKEIEIFDYLSSLDLTDKLLLRDQYYLFLGEETKEEKVVSEIIETIKKKKGGLYG
ncbi:hypothetical protein ES705_11134 [subsurface metagenome]